MLQQVREVGLQSGGPSWSSQVVFLVKESQVLSVVKNACVFSLVKQSHVFSLLKKLLLVQHIQMEITQDMQPLETASTLQSSTDLKVQPNLLPAHNIVKALSIHRNKTQLMKLVYQGNRV